VHGGLVERGQEYPPRERGREEEKWKGKNKTSECQMRPCTLVLLKRDGRRRGIKSDKQ
jgi:hypothetical protein